jgi:hypothetical protein
MTMELGITLSKLGTKAAVITLDPEDEQRIAELVSKLETIFDAYPKKQANVFGESR